MRSRRGRPTSDGSFSGFDALRIGRRRDRSVHRQHIHGVAARRQSVGQDVACLFGAREQHARAVRARIGERIEQRFGDEPLGQEVDADPALVERTGAGVRLTRRGRLLSNELFSRLIPDSESERAA